MENKNIWNKYDTNEERELWQLNEGYKAYLNRGKTERECVAETVAMARERGYRDLDEIVARGEALKAGDKVYAVNMKKSVALFVVGNKPLAEGMNILGAHIDSPRLDIKQNPLFEDTELAYLDTHYYGGIKKYQWVAQPMAIHGVVVKKDGTTVLVNVGENEDDPVFFVSDLLIHLAGEQLEKKAAKVIEGEALDLIVGHMPLKDTEKEAVTAGVLKILKETYDIEEADFL